MGEGKIEKNFLFIFPHPNLLPKGEGITLIYWFTRHSKFKLIEIRCIKKQSKL